jgi:ribosomal protein S18 acetylase RimI-like enzyme
VVPVEDGDREGVRQLIAARWGSETVAVHGALYRPHTLPGLAARDTGGQLVGLLTYRPEGPEWEVVTLDSLREGEGIGSDLLAALVAQARRRGCQRLWLVTTNDNLRALGFYQRRGFHPRALRAGAVAQARRLKPAIPEHSPDGIPIRDELELELEL